MKKWLRPVLVALLAVAALFAGGLLVSADYTLTFYANGGTFVTEDGTPYEETGSGEESPEAGSVYRVRVAGPDMTSLKSGDLLLEELRPYLNVSSAMPGLKRDGYVFAGWYEDAACTKKAFSDHTTHYFKRFTHYAGWVKEADTWPVTFNLNGGTLGSEETKAVTFRVAKREPVLEQREHAIRYSAYKWDDTQGLINVLYWSYDAAGTRPVNAPGEIIPTDNSLVFYAQYGTAASAALSLPASSYTMKTGETKDLSLPSAVKKMRLYYTSDNPDMVWVDQNGQVTVVGETGTKDVTVTITVKRYAQSSPTASCRILVKASVQELSFVDGGGDRQGITGKIGEAVTLKAGAIPEDRVFVSWSFSPAVTFADGTKGTTSTKANVSILVPASPVTITITTKARPLTGIKVNRTQVSLKPGRTAKLTYTPVPATAAVSSVRYYSTNENVATVNEYGVIRGVRGGSCIVSVTVNGKYKKSCKVTVTKVKATKAVFNVKKKTLKKGEKYTLKLKVTPTASWYTNIVWGTSNSKIATISAKGVVKAKKKGKCKITCQIKTVGGKKLKAVCTVTVK